MAEAEAQATIVMKIGETKLNSFVALLRKATAVELCDANISVSHGKIKQVVAAPIARDIYLTIEYEVGLKVIYELSAMDEKVEIYSDGSYRLFNKRDYGGKTSLTVKPFFGEDEHIDKGKEEEDEPVTISESQPKISPDELKSALNL